MRCAVIAAPKRGWTDRRRRSANSYAPGSSTLRRSTRCASASSWRSPRSLCWQWPHPTSSTPNGWRRSRLLPKFKTVFG
ncbi:hypothetical protein T492DRAFT_900705 [Pavlovales sp. CCMP2436]|nr:hypothetical protein T492DRAFT_900705 [Pavlovales sp. CCMP2436]